MMNYNDWNENVGFSGWDRPIGVSQWEDWGQRKPYKYDEDDGPFPYRLSFDEYMEAERENW